MLVGYPRERATTYAHPWSFRAAPTPAVYESPRIRRTGFAGSSIRSRLAAAEAVGVAVAAAAEVAVGAAEAGAGEAGAVGAATGLACTGADSLGPRGFVRARAATPNATTAST